MKSREAPIPFALGGLVCVFLRAMSPPTCLAVAEVEADAVEAEAAVVEAEADGAGASTAAVETSAMLLCR